MRRRKATQKPTQEVVSIETAQNQITLLTANAFKSGVSFTAILPQVASIAKQAQNGFDNPKLENDTKRSLLRHAMACYKTLDENLSHVQLQEASRQNEAILERSDRNAGILERGYATAKLARPGTTVEGMPLHYWHGREYIKERVHPVMEELAKKQALDPNDLREINTLRNLAEMEVRYQNHQESVEMFRGRGDKLVRASQHEDCSERCLQWQGRLYSLDGTSGVVESGEEYVPLEIATESPEVQHTTKAGITYNNGLLGFNCRHRLLSYNPDIEPPPPISKEQQYKQYEINQEQRKLERETREERLRAELFKGVDNDAYEQASAKAKELTRKYKAFCKANERAFYPERLQILKPTNKANRSIVNAPQSLTNTATSDIIGSSPIALNMSTLEAAYGKANAAEFEALLRQAPTDIQTVWNKYADHIKFADIDFKENAFYSGSDGQIRVSLDRDLKGIDGEKFQTTAHEIGHMIDHKASAALIGRNSFVSLGFKNGMIENTLKAEAQEHITEMHKYLQAIAIEQGIDPRGVLIETTYERMSAELKRDVGSTSSIASDIWGGATNNKVVGGWWHPTEYWKTHSVAPEAFAHFYSASITNSQALEYAKQFFPKSYGIFEEMIKEIARS